MRRHSGKSCLFAAILIFCTAFPGGLSVALCAQDSNETVHGFTVDQRFQGSSSSFGQIFKLNTNLSHELGRHVGIDAGVPFYFVNDSASGTTSGSGFRSGVGNVYTSLRLSFKGALNYTSTITGTAPTGDKDKGLSTGRATVDWNNSVQKVIAHRVAPYANVGIANTISDTPFFIRPFSSTGLIGHIEAGSTVSISRLIYVGASGYAVLPSGKQTIISKIVEIHTEPQPPRSSPGNSRGRGVGLTKPRPDRVFETTREVVGTADLASDHGGSTWIGIGPIRGMDLTVGYSRSKRYGLNTVFWGVGKRFGPFGSRPR